MEIRISFFCLLSSGNLGEGGSHLAEPHAPEGGELSDGTTLAYRRKNVHLTSASWLELSRIETGYWSWFQSPAVRNILHTPMPCHYCKPAICTRPDAARREAFKSMLAEAIPVRANDFSQSCVDGPRILPSM